MLWILLTAAAAPLQVARNALQRGLVGDAGPWGATLVRFLFGLPFSLALFMVVAALTPGAAPDPNLRFLIAVAAGAGGHCRWAGGARGTADHRPWDARWIGGCGSRAGGGGGLPGPGGRSGWARADRVCVTAAAGCAGIGQILAGAVRCNAGAIG